MKKFIIILSILAITPAFAEFNRTSGLIDIPEARILPHFGYRIGVDGSFGLGSDSVVEGTDVNFHSSLGLADKFEVYLDVYTISNFTAAIGFCHNFLKNDKFALSWGIHQISYALDVSEVGHGDSTGWHDDLMYYEGNYEKPFELGSAFLVSTYSLNKFVDVSLGIGRGRYVGYGTHSKYFNSDFYHDQGGDWAIGLIAGLDFKLTKAISFMIDGDSRDINLGFVCRYKPIELGLAISKFEWLVWGDESEYSPRLTFSISYVKPEKEPETGIIAGTVYDEPGVPQIIKPGDIIGKVVDSQTNEPLIAQLIVVGTEHIEESKSDGLFEIKDLKPDTYNVEAKASGYVTGLYPVQVNSGKQTKLDIQMKKPEMVLTIVGIKFDFNDPLIKPEYYSILDKAAEIIKDHPENTFEIHGHADSVGPDIVNLGISIARASEVREYFIKKHKIKSSRLIIHGYGDTEPTTDNKTEQGRKKNRRVDFIILGE